MQKERFRLETLFLCLSGYPVYIETVSIRIFLLGLFVASERYGELELIVVHLA